MYTVLYMPYEYACKIDRSGFTKNSEVKYVYAEHNCSHPEHVIVRYTVKTDELFNDIMNAENRKVENQYFMELLKPLESLMGESKICYIIILMKILIKENCRYLSIVN